MGRNATFDYARLLAAIGIVIFHVGSAGAAIGYAALPFFIMLLVFLAFPSARQLRFSDYAGTRIKRLLWPWVVWSGIYGVLKLGEVVFTSASLASEFAPWMLLTGPALHLWFLPFACVSCVAIWPLARCVPSLPPPARVLCSVACIGLAVAIMMAGHLFQTVQPVSQWIHAAPAVVLGAGFAVLGAGKRPVLASMLVYGGALGLLYLTGWPAGAFELSLAGGALLLCLAWPLPDSPLSRSMADISLTLYLAHPMVIAVLLRTTPIPEKSLLMSLAAIACTLLFAVCLQRIRFPLSFNRQHRLH